MRRDTSLFPGVSRRRRILVDDQGGHWEVFELGVTHEGRDSTSLVFSSMHVVRRVREFPLDWYTLSDHELLRVSERV